MLCCQAIVGNKALREPPLPPPLLPLFQLLQVLVLQLLFLPLPVVGYPTRSASLVESSFPVLAAAHSYYYFQWYKWRSVELLPAPMLLLINAGWVARAALSRCLEARPRSTVLRCSPDQNMSHLIRPSIQPSF